MKPEILFEDACILIVNKPAGLLTIPDRNGSQENLLNLLQKKYGHVLTVHRLDRETSGMLCFARTEAAHRNLSLQFEKHTVDKFYLALVDGLVHQTEGEIDKPIGEHPSVPGKMSVNFHQGKPSLTFYRIRETFKYFTLLEVLIKTGRTHQIRVHLQSIGYPLAIDSLYGNKSAITAAQIKGRNFKTGKFSETDRPLMSRTSLHATRLRINHPDSGQQMEWEIPLPKDFQALINQIKKWSS
jgi:23S rRNA pseudouridine955/2504/2580 synthase/23S rRNA pseudouridine1911/1915/1917 synthase